MTSWAFFTQLRISRRFSDGHWTPLGEVRSSRPAMLRPGVWPWRRWCIGRMPQKWRQPSAPCVLRVAGDGSWVHQLQETSFLEVKLSEKQCLLSAFPWTIHQLKRIERIVGLLAELPWYCRCGRPCNGMRCSWQADTGFVGFVVVLKFKCWKRNLPDYRKGEWWQ